MFFAPWTPLGYLELDVRRRLARAQQTTDRGASAIEWVIITGVLVLMAGIVGKLIYDKVESGANAIELPDAPGGAGGGNGGGQTGP